MAKIRSNAFLVGSGIFLSRIAGLIRERVFAHYFGNSDASDAFKAALKIPNFLQNLLGEGVLSASFIPVYAKLLSEKHDEDAEKVASMVFILLMLLVSALVVAGVLTTPFLIDLIAPGFDGEKRALAVRLVQIFFPGVGFLVLSAWCLGILNSHQKFFLSYFAPVIWNLTIISFLLYFGSRVDQSTLAIKVAWGLVAGSVLQFLVQIPLVFRLIKKMRWTWAIRHKQVQTVLKNFSPMVVTRGVVQVSAYIDNIIASFLPTGAVSALAYSQTLYLLPISLFGMSVSASELPAMSQARGTDAEVAAYLKSRLQQGLRKITFFIIPTVISFFVLGDVIVGAVFQTGAFDLESTHYVWAVLAGATVGLLANTRGRLYSSAYFSLRDTRTPLKFAVVRVALTSIFGYVFALHVAGWFDLPPFVGTIGLTLSSGFAGWVEYLLLKRGLTIRIGDASAPKSYQATLWLVALVAGAAGYLVKTLLHGALSPIPMALVVLPVFGVIYFLGTAICKVPESRSLLKRV